MKQYILIQNDGEVEVNSFELIGASTKRNDDTKIGFFGSGLKYSIAYMLRNNIDFRIFSGENELKITTESANLREQQFSRICINDKPTSYTTTMGPTWTEDWFVLREIYCNALDESNCQVIKPCEETTGSIGKTRIYIEITTKLKIAIDNWDEYFSDEREPLFTCTEVYTSSLGEIAKQPIKVYSKTTGILYRKGIQVGRKRDMLYDYECESVLINEDRTSKYLTYLSYGISSLFSQFTNKDYIENVLRSGKEKDISFEYSSLNSAQSYSSFSSLWIQFSKDNLLVVEEISGRYSTRIESSIKPYYLIPKYFCEQLKKNIPDIIILGIGAQVGNISFEFCEKNDKCEYLLKHVLSSLLEMEYQISHTISIVDFTHDGILGQANPQTKNIYLSYKLFELGKRKIAEVLIEENEHCETGFEDESRSFQTHLISKFLGQMEIKAGLFL